MSVLTRVGGFVRICGVWFVTDSHDCGGRWGPAEGRGLRVSEILGAAMVIASILVALMLVRGDFGGDPASN